MWQSNTIIDNRVLVVFMEGHSKSKHLCEVIATLRLSTGGLTVPSSRVNRTFHALCSRMQSWMLSWTFPGSYMCYIWAIVMNLEKVIFH
jgi:hypothetical protein